MEPGIGCCTKTVLLVIALSGYLVLEVSSTKLQLFNSKIQKFLKFKPALGSLNLLRQCRRQLTFLGSAGLGHFITRIIHESPLTPLPLPPLEDPPHWKFLTLPLHVSAPYFRLIKGFMGKSHHFYKDFDHFPHQPSLLREAVNSINKLSWKKRLRYRRDLSKTLKPSPIFVAKAVKKTLKFLHSALKQHKGTIQWLTRLCR